MTGYARALRLAGWLLVAVVALDVVVGDALSDHHRPTPGPLHNLTERTTR